MTDPRLVTLALIDSHERPLGKLAPFPVELPFWQEVGEITQRAEELYGAKVTVLRILSTEPGLIRGGKVTYLAETMEQTGVALAPFDVEVGDDPRRPDYARPGGPARSLEWAAQALGAPVTAEHLRTWNLSAIWRLGTPAGTMWLKQVPHFFRHEPYVLSYVDLVYAFDDAGRMLLPDIPGDDLYGAPYEVRESIVIDLLAIQLRAVDDLGRLLHDGVPDLRGCRLGDRLRTLIDEDWVQQRLNAAAACGLPDTLVHGDMHPGNVRGTPESRTIIDWGDSFLGQPAFDIIRLAEGLAEPEAERLTAFWAERWRDAFPPSDPLAAVEILRPVAALRNALTFATFLANIEESEHPYHAGDVPFWLAQARALVR
jgi:hypothetical protein